MSQHRATIGWALQPEADFRKGQYSRVHAWTFDGGVTVPASPSPSVVPAPYSDPGGVDPEEAYVAAIASCHMLTFLHLASRAGFEVMRYDDAAVGTITTTRRNERRVSWVSRVELTPRITYRNELAPDAEQEAALHEQAHEQCFIASSVKTEIVITTCRRESAADRG